MLSEVDELPSIQLGDYTLRFELEDLTPFGKEVAINELRETPEIKAQAVEELRAMLKGRFGCLCISCWPHGFVEVQCRRIYGGVLQVPVQCDGVN